MKVWNSFLKYVISTMVAAFLFFVGVGCGGNGYTYTPLSTVKVTVASGENYTCERSVNVVQKGEDLTLELTFDDGYIFKSCSYADYTANTQADGSVLLTLKNVKYPTFLEIVALEVKDGILYNTNGGRLLNGSTDTSFFEYKPKQGWRRANTSIGVYDVARDGYTLVGWNTMPDGSGTHIGLGSRVDIPDGGVTVLYAEWRQWTPVSDFEYEEIEGGVRLTKYIGDKALSELVIPMAINGKTVTEIGTRFADHLEAKILILPHTMSVVSERAFAFCAFEEVYVSDNIASLPDVAFSGGVIRTLHINAVHKPHFLATSEAALFPDKMDRLMALKDVKKMVFFAGCSMAYGLHSPEVAKEFPEYEIVDMATMGGTMANAQLDCIIPYISEEDVFIHAPEGGSGFQLFGEHTFDWNFLTLCESNYDLLTHLDLRNYKMPFAALRRFNEYRLAGEPCEYDAWSGICNEYGDVVIERGELNTDESQGEEYTFDMQYVTSETVERMCGYYDQIRSKGAEVLFSFSPMNLQGMPQEDVDARVWETFEAFYKTELTKRGYPVVSKIEDYMLDGRYFFNANYHLNEFGRDLRTGRLIDDLKTYFKNKA